jgi:hypothetical protein
LLVAGLANRRDESRSFIAAVSESGPPGPSRLDALSKVDNRPPIFVTIVRQSDAL